MRLVTVMLGVIVGVFGALPVVHGADARIGVLRPGPCPVNLETNREVDCYRIRLPQVRSDLSQGRVDIQIAIVRARNPRPDPILFVMGGPDFPGVDPFSTFYLGGKAFSRHRDWILFDARGTGSSHPYLGCPEFDEFEAEFFPENQGPDPSHQDEMIAANRACRQRLVSEGVAPRAYGAADVARDIRDLRVALGVDQWNVVGLSAGGEATLELMRLDAEAIRSVILDSPVTRALQPSFDYVEHGQRLLQRALRLCARHVDCEAAYPSLKRRFFDRVDRLNQDPRAAHIEVAGGGTVTWMVDGVLLLDEAGWLAGFPDTVRYLPRILDSFARGHAVDYFETFVLEPPTPVNGILAQGRTTAQRCEDAINFQTDRTLRAAKARVPSVAKLFADRYRRDKRVCGAWNVGRSAPAGRGYLDSRLPVLTLRGEWDNSADDNGHVLGQARHFPNGWAFTFPSHGHIQVVEWQPGAACAAAIAADFLADPQQAPDASCIEDIPPIVFEIGDR